MKPSEQQDACKHIALATHRAGSSSLGFFNPDEARTSIDYLVKFRNSCAHDDRLYCAKVGPHHECNFAMMLKRIERFLPADEYGEMLQNVVDLLANSASGSSLMRHVVESMGFVTEKRDGMTYITFKWGSFEESPSCDTYKPRSK